MRDLRVDRPWNQGRQAHFHRRPATEYAAIGIYSSGQAFFPFFQKLTNPSSTNLSFDPSPICTLVFPCLPSLTSPPRFSPRLQLPFPFTTSFPLSCKIPYFGSVTSPALLIGLVTRCAPEPRQPDWALFSTPTPFPFPPRLFFPRTLVFWFCAHLPSFGSRGAGSGQGASANAARPRLNSVFAPFLFG